MCKRRFLWDAKSPQSWGKSNFFLSSVSTFLNVLRLWEEFKFVTFSSLIKEVTEMSENLNLKIRLKSLTRGQFHQRYAREFFVQKSFQQLFSSYMYLEKAAKTMFIWKICAYNVYEIDTRRGKMVLFPFKFVVRVVNCKTVMYHS